MVTRTRLYIKLQVHCPSCFVRVRTHARTQRGDRVLTVLKYETAAHALACNAIKLHSLHMQFFDVTTSNNSLERAPPERET
jgi:hypothetical protein